MRNNPGYNELAALFTEFVLTMAGIITVLAIFFGIKEHFFEEPKERKPMTTPELIKFLEDREKRKWMK